MLVVIETLKKYKWIFLEEHVESPGLRKNEEICSRPSRVYRARRKADLKPNSLWCWHGEQMAKTGLKLCINEGRKTTSETDIKHVMVETTETKEDGDQMRDPVVTVASRLVVVMKWKNEIL